MAKEQELKLKAKAEGFDKASADQEKITKGQRELTGAVKEHGEVVREVAEQEERLGEGFKRLAVRGLKLAAAYKAFSTAIKLIPGVNLLIGSTLRIIGIVRDETRERLALAKAMVAQGRALDDLHRKQLAQKATIENIAAVRREGGFENAGASERARALGARALEQFEQLGAANANTAAGLFGDAPGVTQRQITDAAILAKEGRLPIEALQKATPSRRLRILDRVRERFSGQIDRFDRTESEQGQGQGRSRFDTASVTERAKRMADALVAGPGGAGTDDLVEAFRARGIREPEKLARLIQGFQGDVGALFRAVDERQKVSMFTGGQFGRGDIQGEIDVPDPTAPGFRLPLTGMLGLAEEFGPSETVNRLDLNRAIDAVQDIRRQGMLGVREATTPGTVIYNDNRVTQHNGKYRGVGAQGRRKPSRQSLIE